MLDSLVFAWYNAITAKENTPNRKEVNRMKLSEKIAAVESGEYAVTWTTPAGSIMKAADYGPYYVVYRNGEPMGAINSPDDLDTFAAANHYTA